MPEWYLHIRIARYLGVDPDRLSEMSPKWRQWALESMEADAIASRNRLR